MRFVFTIGGVLSGLGKGVTTASLGLILKKKGYSVTAVKIDPYISIDAGTMRPVEHGETFVTKDGGEIDQDLGNYERFLEVDLEKDNNITTGKIYQSVIEKERSFYYQGRDAQMFPDVINEVKEKIYKKAKGFDICLVEIGGTTGDLENMPFLHAAREIGREFPSAYLMVTYLPYLRNVGELKTKPTQHAVMELRSVGIFPDIIITRNEIPLDFPRKETISKRCFIDMDCIIDNPDIDLIYKIPLVFEKEKMAEKVLSKLGLENRKTKLLDWKRMVENIENPETEVKIAIIGKYFRSGESQHKDVYVSVYEALNHASAKLRVKIKVIPIDAETLESQDYPDKYLDSLEFDGLIGPQGWGKRGVKGIVQAISYVRRKKIPYLGLCFGMQMAICEIAQNLAGLSGAQSAEVDKKTLYPVIHLMEEQKKYMKNNQYGGTIRLGEWPCSLKIDSLLYTSYMKNKWIDRRKSEAIILERHRHRYEVNSYFIEQLRSVGVVFSGMSPDGNLVEGVELKREMHPFFVGVQYHPEYISRPLNPHPLFVEFLRSIA